MQLQAIDRVKTISKEDFVRLYYRKQKPVIIEEAIADWPAFTKWNFDYIKAIAADKQVPLYDDRPVDHKDGFNQPHATMRMDAYIDLLQQAPTKFRIFLWNLLKEVPALQADYRPFNLGLPIMKGLPMLFFGGRDSHTFMHYDIDLANIFHFHFQGKKEVVLFDQKQNKFLYKIAHSLIVREDINWSNPDEEKWPALHYVTGFKGTLEHGQMLYMPEGYWHYMKYITPGFSMSLRSIARKPRHLAKALYNVLVMRYFDQMMRRLRGQNWIDYKNQQAIERTHRHLAKIQSKSAAA